MKTKREERGDESEIKLQPLNAGTKRKNELRGLLQKVKFLKFRMLVLKKN